ncbi:MAG: hypothetical protein D6773_16325 [Alphaproteobacteria bacterium]|nr:MAG: hypothetical protein D6773_16325 [Alphaproteobacteria bacterium]
MGERTTEIFVNTGDQNNPFQRLGGGFIEVGCMSGASVALMPLRAGDAIVWVDDTGVVRAAEGFAGVRISTHAVERDIAAQTDKRKLVGFAYAARGHSFYALSGDNFTWVYDAITGLWHERKTHGMNKWCVNAVEAFNDQLVAGDCQDGVLRLIDADAHDEAGKHLAMTVRVPVHAWPDPIVINKLYVDTMPGQGLNSSDPHNSNPLLAMKVSRDGGHSFGNERTAAMGKLGEYTKRAKFNRLGRSLEDGFVIDLTMSAAVVRAITGLAGDVERLEA